MSGITISHEVFESREKFEDWYITTVNALFPSDPILTDQIYIVSKTFTPEKLKLFDNDDENILLFERILVSVNLIYNGDDSLIDYKNKRRKLNAAKSTIFSVAVYIIKTYYDLNYTKLAKLLKMNHATVIYHYEKQAGLNDLTKLNKINYLRLLKHLKNEKIISVAQESRSDSKRLLSSSLFIQE